MREVLTYPVRDIVPYINWVYFFHAWGMEPRFAAVAHIHDCSVCRAEWIASFDEAERAKAQEAISLYQEAMGYLRRWADKPACRALFLLADAYSDGDDIVVDGQVRIPFLRQQHAGKSGYTLCLSDFIAPRGCLSSASADISNRIGVFVTTVSVDCFCDDGSVDGSSDTSLSTLITSTLADRLAEATAEKMHEEVRKHYWGYAKDERLTMAELHAERFQGIRPAVGYPSLPDQSIHFLIDELLHMSDVGVRFSDTGAMIPQCSVSGFMFAHPRAQYFAVGPIGEDQLMDYSCRRAFSADTLRSFLTSNL